MNLEQHLADSLQDLGVGPGDPLGIACSGGGDSTALLHLLARRRPLVLHVDHGLRAGSHEDAAFVRDEAGRLGVDIELLEVEVDTSGRLGPQAAARQARYAALDEAAARRGLRWVATAHTLDDQAETAMINVLRGSGSPGIPPRRGIFVRPLLGVSRQSLRDWLTSSGIGWREDPSNSDDRFERSWLRSEIMPLLEKRRPGVVRSLASAAARAREDSEALDEMAEMIMRRARVDDAGVLLPRSELEGLAPALERRVIRQALVLCHGQAGWKATHDEVEALRHLSGHARIGNLDIWRLPAGTAVMRHPPPAPEPLVLPDEGVLESEDWGVRVRVMPRRQARSGSWWHTAVPAEEGIILRSRVPGDRVRTAAGSRKVQDVLIDAKIPRPLRGFVPVLANARQALAVVGVTSSPEPAAKVVAADPLPGSWSREAVWVRT